MTTDVPSESMGWYFFRRYARQVLLPHATFLELGTSKGLDMADHEISIGNFLCMDSGVRLETCQGSADDMALVQDFISGRASAFDVLYERHAKQVYNLCLGILGNPDDARDAMQDTFVQLYNSLPRFRGQSKFSTWLYRIAVNKCIDTVRRRPKWETVDSVEWFRHEQQPHEDRLVEEQVRLVIAKLKPQHRAVLVLYYFQQLSYVEIAETLGWSVEQVRSNLHRARKAFRHFYNDEGDGIEV